jgi:uncharacterized protein YodC (DUF2158 family)
MADTRIINVGDVVVLKSAPEPRMTVAVLEGNVATVVWFSGGILCTERLPVEALKRG